MESYLSTKQRVAIFFLSLSIILALLFAESERARADEGFAQWFRGYFLSAEPKQTITQELYTQPKAGALITVPIIVYHSVRPNYPGETPEVKQFATEPSVLEAELSFLQDHSYHTISFNDLALYFETGRPLPSKPIILSFDDGWENQYTYAFPLLKKYGATATFFVFTNAVGHQHFFTWEEIRTMSAEGMTFGSHSKTHPYLTQITDPKQLENEILGSKQILEEKLGKPVTAFAYPFGLFNASTTEAVARAGYTIGRSSKVGTSHAENSLLTVTAIYDRDSLSLFEGFEKLFGTASST